MNAQDAIAALADFDNLDPEKRERARDFWLLRTVRALWGDILTDDENARAGLLTEFRSFKRSLLVGGTIGGTFGLLLQVISTFNLQEPIRHLFRIIGGGS